VNDDDEIKTNIQWIIKSIDEMKREIANLSSEMKKMNENTNKLILNHEKRISSIESKTSLYDKILIMLSVSVALTIITSIIKAVIIP